MAGNDAAGSIQACALRVSRLNSDGSIAVGSNNMIVTNALIKLEVKAVMETGSDIVVNNACGGIFAALKSGDMLKRYDLTMTVPNPDVELEEMLSTASLITSGGQSIGVASPAVGSSPGPGVCTEAWSKAWIGGGPPPGQTFTDGVTATNTSLVSATADFTSADQGRTVTGTGIASNTTILTVTNSTTVVLSHATTATATGVSITIGRPGAYWRYVFPHWLPGVPSFTLEGGANTPVYSGPTFENPAVGDGPVHDWPSGVVTTAKRSYTRFRDTALPDLSTIGYQTTS